MKAFYPTCLMTSSTGPRRGASSGLLNGGRMVVKKARTIPASSARYALRALARQQVSFFRAGLAREHPRRFSRASYEVHHGAEELTSASRRQRLALEFLLQIQPLADVHKPR